MSRIATSPSWWVALASLTLALGFASPGWGLKMLPQGLETEDRDVPITVTAERMEVDHAAHIIRFHGYVITTKGSMIMRSNLLEVFNTGSGEGLGNIQRIVAQGDVQFENGPERATGDEAVYVDEERKVVLTGRVRAWDDENEVTGHQLTLYIDEDKSVVTGGPDRRVGVTLKSREQERLPLYAPGERNGIASPLKDAPIHVTADRMEADRRHKTVFFEGKVIMRQADFRMDSNELEVFDSGQGEQRVSKIVARGSVRLDRGGKVATGDKAVYFERDRKFLLTGNARAWENQNVVSGSRMEIYLDEDKSVVLGDENDQVEVTLYPRQGKSAKRPLPLPTVAEGEGERAARP